MTSDRKELNCGPELIANRLRDEARQIAKIREGRPGYGTSTFLLTDAADEIERLAALLRKSGPHNSEEGR